MGRTITTIVVFVVSFIIVLGVLQFIVHVAGAVLKLGIGVVVAIIAAAVAYAIARGATASQS